MKILRTMFAAAFAAAALPALAADVYFNDFSTRVSQSAVPSSAWQEAQPYPARSALLCVRHSAAKNSYDAASLATYFDTNAEGGFQRPSIDGWFLPYFNDNYKLVPRYLVAANSEGLAENPVLTFSYGVTATPRTGYALHPIHNEFTNGQLRVQVDLKAPITWNRTGITSTAAAYYSTLKVFPVYRKYMDILAWGGSECDALVSPGKFGLRSSGGLSGNNLLRSFPQYWDKNGTTQRGNNDSAKFTDDGSDGKTNYWFRYVVTYDLDAGTFGGEIYRFSKAKGHPSLDTAPSDATATGNYVFSGAPAMTALSAETGGIAGIGFSAYGNFTAAESSGFGCTTNKVFADNIRLSWKAPGADDFEVFYENDFTTRRYRTICAPASGTAGAYAQSTGTLDDSSTFSGYQSGGLTAYNITPEFVGAKTDVQPVGLDGWRRLPVNDTTTGRPGVIAYGNTENDKGGTGGNMLTYGNQSGSALIGQTLGKSYSSGVVRIVGDVRLPKGSASITTAVPSARRAAIGLGSAALYSGDGTAPAAQLAAGFGYQRLEATGESGHKAYYLGASGATAKLPTRTYPDACPEPATNEWVRVDISADLDAKTYSVTATPLGALSLTASDTPTSAPAYSATDIPFAAGVSDIGSFYLYGYGYGNATTASYIDLRVCWDNIRVWHDADLIYDNDFTTRTRNIPSTVRETGYLAAAQYNIDGGQDHWVRRDYTGAAGFDARAWVRDDNGNEVLALGRSGEAGRTILVGNSLGASVSDQFRFTADIRPPCQWSAANGSATISLGDSQMAQTEISESIYGGHRLLSFGISGTNAALKNLSDGNTYCPYYFKGTTAQVGGTALDTVIDDTHWYRFRIDANPATATCDARLYDMGTAHPTAETKGGTLVATATGIAFENPLAAGEGVATIHIAGNGLSGALGSLGIDPAHVLIDNLGLSVPDPLMLILR